MVSFQTRDRFEGFIITTFAEAGPVPVIAITSLDEMTITKLSIVGMTITSMGSGLIDQSHYRLHGPIPVPDTPAFEAFTMTFSVEAPDSPDIRVVQSGKLSNAWLIFDVNHRNELFSLHRRIESVLASEIRNIRYERELDDQKNMKRIFDKIQQLTREAPLAVPATVELPSQREQIKPIYFYMVNQQGELEPIISGSQVELTSYPLLVIVNTVLKQIFVLKNREDIPRRLVFLSSRAASNLNAQQWKNEFQIRDISDPFESKILIDKASILLKEY
ncbi:MAG: hypothetical protein ACFFD4_24915 [Candidatus Odinarchaeota archaeon]